MHSMDIDEIMWLDHPHKAEKLEPGSRFTPYMLHDNGECLHFKFLFRRTKCISLPVQHWAVHS